MRACCLLPVGLGTVISPYKCTMCNHAKVMQVHGSVRSIEAHIADGLEAIDVEAAVLGP